MKNRQTEADMIRSLKDLLKEPLSVSMLNDEDCIQLKKWMDEYNYLAVYERYTELFRTLDLLTVIRNTRSREEVLYQSFRRFQDSEELLPEIHPDRSPATVPADWRGLHICLIPPFDVFPVNAVICSFRKRGAVVSLNIDYRTDYVIEGKASEQARSFKGIMVYREYKKLVSAGYAVQYLHQDDISFLDPFGTDLF